MLNSLQHAGTNFGREISRTLSELSKEWRELLCFRGDSPVRISHMENAHGDMPVIFSRWSFPVDEVVETDREITLNVVLPDMAKGDCLIAIEGNVLYLSGERHAENEIYGGSYHVMERAYGAFQHAIPLPHNVDDCHLQQWCIEYFFAEIRRREMAKHSDIVRLQCISAY